MVIWNYQPAFLQLVLHGSFCLCDSFRHLNYLSFSEGIFTTRVRSTTQGYVFTGVCLFGGGGQAPVPSPFPASGPRSFRRGITPSPVTGPVQSPVWGLAWGVPPSPVTGPVQSPVPGPAWGTPARTGQGISPRTGQGVPPPPPTREHVMLCRGRYASSGHAGGFSCHTIIVL